MAAAAVVYKSVPKDEKPIEYIPPIATPKGFGVRHLQTLLLFICLVMGFTMRSQLSVLMVAMTAKDFEDCKTTSYTTTDITSQTSINLTRQDSTNVTTDFNCTETDISKWNVYRTYNWSKSTQEIITFSFFVGYTGMQLPMGILAQKYGGKYPIMVALAVNGVLSMLTPWTLIVGGWIAASVSRLLQGMTQAAFYPSTHTILAQWSPLSERGRLSTYAYTGSQLGTILAFQLSGFFAGNPTLGWPASFWLFGSLSLLACAVFGWLGAATPSEHPWIGTEEMEFILRECNSDHVTKKRKTPWKEIIKCKAIWGQMITQAGSGAGYLLLLTQTPLYMSNILGVDIKRNGVYSSLPYAAMYMMSLTFGYLADFGRNRNIMRVVNIRRTANSIGMVGCAIFMLAFSFVDNTALAVCFLVMSLACHSGVHVGFHINQIDLAPNFAGSLMALGNTMGNLTGLLVPVIVSSIVTDVTNHWQWQIVFMIFAAIMTITNTVFVIFAKADIQPWNYYGEQEQEPERELKLTGDKKINEKEEILKEAKKKSLIKQ